MERVLGKIESAVYGFGGYQDAQFGLAVALKAGSLGSGDFWGFWADPPSSNAQWTKEDQIRHAGETAMRIAATLQAAKKRHVAELAGTPVEITFENLALKSWRVLDEVL